MILENNLALRVSILTVALLEGAYSCGCMNTMYSILCRVYDVCFHPAVRTYVRMYDLLAHVASRPFSTSIFSLRVCRKNLQKIAKLLLELWHFPATARGVIRPAAAIAGSSDEPHRTRSFRESISERNGPFYLHHFA